MPPLPVSLLLNSVTQKQVGIDSTSGRTLQDLPRSRKKAFESILTMITPTITNLLKLPLETGMSHLVKATFGSLIVSGCGFRYQGTPHNTSQYRTSLSLRTGADLYGGIFTPVDMYRYVFFVLLVHSFFPALRGTPLPDSGRMPRHHILAGIFLKH